MTKNKLRRISASVKPGVCCIVSSTTSRNMTDDPLFNVSSGILRLSGAKVNVIFWFLYNPVDHS